MNKDCLLYLCVENQKMLEHNSQYTSVSMYLKNVAKVLPWKDQKIDKVISTLTAQ